MIRVNDVIMTRIDGAIESTVNSAMSWIARSVTPPFPWPRLMLMSCDNTGSAKNPVAIRLARKMGFTRVTRRTHKVLVAGPAPTPSSTFSKLGE